MRHNLKATATVAKTQACNLSFRVSLGSRAMWGRSDARSPPLRQSADARELWTVVPLPLERGTVNTLDHSTVHASGDVTMVDQRLTGPLPTQPCLPPWR